MAETFSIGQVARATACKVQTIRYYEEIGLLPQPVRTAGNQRVYRQADIDRLAFIRHSRDLGFPLEAIRDLLSLSDRPDRSCEAVDGIARAQLDAVEGRIRRLEALRAELARMIEQCRGGTVGTCRVIEVLSDHDLCGGEHGAGPEATPPAMGD